MSFGIKIKNSERVQILLGNLKVISQKINDDLTANFAQFVYNKLMYNIKTDHFRFKPLSPRYLLWKIQHGRSEKIFISTAQYVNSIQVRQVGKNWAVIVPDAMFHGESGMTMRQLAMLLENGSVLKHIPPRPLWAKTNAQCRAAFPAFMQAYARKMQAAVNQNHNILTTGFSQGHNVNNG
jgi:hypothetical protein